MCAEPHFDPQAANGGGDGGDGQAVQVRDDGPAGQDQDRPDLQFQIVHSGYDARPWFPGWRKPPMPLLSCGAILLDPESRGEVTLASPDPLALPNVQEVAHSQ